MKKIFLFLLLFYSWFSLSAQVPVNRSARSVLARDARIQGYLNLIMPVYPDTATANTNKGNDSLGAWIQIRASGNVYHRDTSAGTHKWSLVVTPSAGVVTSVFGRIGDIISTTGDYNASQVTNAVSDAGAYPDPAWITQLSWSKIISTPTTIAGYGITDGATLTDIQTLTNKTLTAPKINVGGDQTGDMYYRDAGGLFQRLPLGMNGQHLKIVSGLPAWVDTSVAGGSGGIPPNAGAGYRVYSPQFPEFRSFTTSLPLQWDTSTAHQLNITMSQSNTSTPGWLSASDWNTFNNKGNTNSNIGSGHRLAIPNTNNIKSLFCIGCAWDSVNNSNALTLTVIAVTPGGSNTQVQYNNSGSFGGSSNFTYNNTTKKMHVDSGDFYTALTDTLRSHNIVQTATGQDTIYNFGNSITFGYNNDDQLNRYSSVFARMMNLYEVNYGLNSSTMMKRSPQDPWGAANMIDRQGLIPTKTGRRKYIMFCYGVNDLRWNTANYTGANFKTDYSTVINTCLSQGWSASDIILVSPFYVKDPEAYAADVVTTGNPLVTAARHAEFADTVHKLAIQFGTKYVEGYLDTKNNLGKAGLADNVHLNPAGNEFVANDIYQTLFAPGMRVTKDTQAVAIDGLIEARELRIKRPDSLINHFYILGWRQSDHKIGITDPVHAIPPFAINNVGLMGLDSQATRGYKRFQDNIAIGTLPTGSLAFTVYKDGSELPGMELQDGDVTTPNYSSVGFVPALATHTINRIGSFTSNGGVSIAGFTNTSEDRALAFNGYSGKTTVVNAVTSFASWKHNGSTNRTTLGASEFAFDFNNGGTLLMRMLGSGSIGVGRTPVQKFDVYDAAASLNINVETGCSTCGAGFQAKNSNGNALQAGSTGNAQTAIGLLLSNYTYFQSNGSDALFFRSQGPGTVYKPIYYSMSNVNGEFLVGGWNASKQHFIGPSATNYTGLFDSAFSGVIGLHVNNSGHGGIGIAATSGAWWKLAAGTTTIAPQQFVSGPLLTSPIAGAVEFLTDKWYGTIGTSTARKEFAMFDIAGTAGRIPFETTNGRLTDNSNFAYDGTTLTVPQITLTSGALYAPIVGSFSGVGTATTVFTVTIGQTMANNTYKVNATPTSALSAALFYVTNKTTTTFDVTYLTGLTGTVTFDWSVFK